jgi:hypothetical protein
MTQEAKKSTILEALRSSCWKSSAEQPSSKPSFNFSLRFTYRGFMEILGFQFCCTRALWGTEHVTQQTQLYCEAFAKFCLSNVL